MGHDASDGFAQNGRLLEEQTLDVPRHHRQTVLEVDLLLWLAVTRQTEVEVALAAIREQPGQGDQSVMHRGSMLLGTGVGENPHLVNSQECVFRW